MRSTRYLNHEMFYEVEKLVGRSMKRELVRFEGSKMRFRGMYPAMYDVEDDEIEEALANRYGTEVV